MIYEIIAAVPTLKSTVYIYIFYFLRRTCLKLIPGSRVYLCKRVVKRTLYFFVQCVTFPLKANLTLGPLVNLEKPLKCFSYHFKGYSRVIKSSRRYIHTYNLINKICNRYMISVFSLYGRWFNLV